MEFYSHIEITVSKNGKHLFATHPRSARDKQEALEIYQELHKRFPKDDGFEISVTGWQVEGEDLTNVCFSETYYKK